MGPGSLERIKGSREMDSLSRWWPGGLAWPVGTANLVVILWLLVFVGTFCFRRKVKCRLYINRMETFGEAGAWVTMR